MQEDEQRKSLYQVLSVPALAQKCAEADRMLHEAFAGAALDRDLLTRALWHGANLDRPLPCGMTPLAALAARRELDMMRVLLVQGARIDAVGTEGTTALDEAVLRNWPDGIDLLRSKGGHTRADLDAEEETPYSYQVEIDGALVVFSRKGSPATLAFAIELGADPDVSSLRKSGMAPVYLPLHVAVASCRPREVEQLLYMGADPSLKTGHGESIADMLWYAKPEQLFLPEWREIFGMLRERAQVGFLMRLPEDMTADDLRIPVPVKNCRETRLMHFLVARGRADIVLDVLSRERERPLTAQDFRTRNFDDRIPETFLSACARAEVLEQFFTPAVWQGRLEEMMSLRRDVKDNAHCARIRMDFDKAAHEVLRYRQDELRLRSRREAPRLKRGNAP